jgi:uncharacterized protein YkwD
LQGLTGCGLVWLLSSYQKLVMKFKFLPFVLLVIAGLFSCSKYTTPVYTYDEPVRNEPVVTGNTPSGMESSILYYVNAHRRSLGLSALQLLEPASQQAYNHSRNMATGATGFGHDGFSQRVSNISSAVGRVSASAENVAYGNLSAKEVVDVWINSAGHRRNMEGNYNQTGIGVYTDRRGVLYFTQLFVRR